MTKVFLFIYMVACSFLLHSQPKDFDIHTVVFYNVENLFDTIDDRFKYDNDFTPNGLYRYTDAVYRDKIAKLSKVLSQIGRSENPKTPAIIGLCEVENRSVLNDLINHDFLQQENYGIVHYESPDERGIDVALLYQKAYFTKLKHQVFSPRLFDEDGRRDYSRDQLVVSGLLDGEPIHFIVNHWPSRRGGLIKSEPKRIVSAKLNLTLIDSIFDFDPKAKIILMGDFNDDPNNKSLKQILKATGEWPDSSMNTELFNPMSLMFRRGYHSLVYRDNLNLFDQIILTSSLLKQESGTFRFYKAGIFNKAFLIEQYGRYQGYPYRSFEQGHYHGGYSDHFPVYVYLIRESR